MKRLLATIGIVASLAFLTGCPDQGTQGKGVAIQETTMVRAMQAVPVPTVQQFTTRKSIARWIEYANAPDQTRYVYVMLTGVGYLGYYVADSAPVNICTSMTPPQRIIDRHHGDVVVTAPALDGVYYGAGQCNMWYLFDKTTGAQIEVGGSGLSFFTSTVPLNIKAPKLEVVERKAG